ncbi:putative dolichyldiphosphatase 1 [Penaeus vannamei]|uniref:Putative dolichyldiphosphatase 1 n=1 Tax=Penaeus vannamei TaxID=6689 RepID=A0A423SS10_PENVA|nr:putative dolichyldiphosphatase 1 [Penaeus vannamei]
MTDIEWKAFSLTHVEYPKGDIIGQLLAISSLAPVAIIVGFVTLILFRRDLHTITFFGGALLNEGINLLLKHIIAEPRPWLRKGLYKSMDALLALSNECGFSCSTVFSS